MRRLELRVAMCGVRFMYAPRDSKEKREAQKKTSGVMPSVVSNGGPSEN